jgi:hypothetical protein
MVRGSRFPRRIARFRRNEQIVTDYSINRSIIKKSPFSGSLKRIGDQMSANREMLLHISEEVERLMEQRGILREDVRRVIFHAETTGEKFIDPSTGRSLASLRPGRVMYWVEYSGTGGEFLVHTAYSHRMEAKRGSGA